MLKIAVVYFSQSGVTAQLAGAVIEGLQAAGQNLAVEVFEHRIQGSEIIAGRFENQALLDVTQLFSVRRLIWAVLLRNLKRLQMPRVSSGASNYGREN